MSPPAANPNALPDPRICERARLSRDPRFDGLFFTAVTSTGIYCRPTCPAPTPKLRNVRYYANAAAAEAAGFRPCLRCRPELSPADGAWRRGDDTVARALKLIDQGLLAEQPLSALAERVHVGERQLRRLFVERLGAPPIGVHGTRRLLFAKQLLTETALPITEIALAAGFGSLRRFNATFLEAYGMAPRDVRKREPAGNGGSLSLRLNYRPPYDFAAMLDFLRGRALPGVEAVDADSYLRVAGDAAAPGWLRVSAAGNGEHALTLELQGIAPSRLLGVVERVRRMFDLDADPRAIGDVLARDARLRTMLRRRPGLRLPSGWDGFEIALRAIEFCRNRHPVKRQDDWREGDNALLRRARAQLDEYFAGARRTFDLPLSPAGTEFQRDVWTTLATIPYGETISYAQLATRVGKPSAMRAVGAANGRNPLPIVLPCHRVIGADGALTGFGGGLPTKQFLLKLEGALPPAFDLFS